MESSSTPSRRPVRSGPVVLVVEDDVEVSNQVCDLLTHRGVEALAAYQGPEALQMFAQEAPDAVILDLMLPRMNGIQVLERIRKLPGGGGVPVLVMSAVYQDPRAFEKDFQRLEVIAFLAKPFSPFLLADRLDEVLGRTSPSPSPPPSGPPPVPPTLSSEEKALPSKGRAAPVSTPLPSQRPAPRTATAPPTPSPLRSSLPPDPGLGPLPTSLDRLSLLRACGALVARETTGILTLEWGQGSKVVIGLRSGMVVRVTSSEKNETWERVRLLSAPQREGVAQKILGRLLEASICQVCFEPQDLPMASVDLTKVSLLSSLYQASASAFDFSDQADALARHVTRSPRILPSFTSILEDLHVSGPLATALAAESQGMSLDQMFNAVGPQNHEMVRLLWFLEVIGGAEFVRP